MTDFHYDLDAQGVATITWDLPGKSMNVLTMDGAAELDGLIDRALADEAVRGVVITSGKDSFAGGMDLNMIAGMKEAGGAQGVFDGVMSMQQVDGIDLPAGGRILLEPGGLHLMLLDVDPDLAVGDTVALTLTFEGAGQRTVDAEIVPLVGGDTGSQH